MKLSLRVRVLFLVAVIHVATLALGFVAVTREITRQKQELAAEYTPALAVLVGATIDQQGGLSVAPLLRWPHWRLFQDALIVRTGWQLDARGELAPRGAFLNPLGREARDPLFDTEGVLRDVRAAIERRETIQSHGGIALPIEDARGDVWGGTWFQIARPQTAADLATRLAPWFVASLLLLTFGTFFVLRRYVLDPVRGLARGARRVAAGEPGVRVAETGRDDELSALVRDFNAMSAQVESYSARLAREVEAATQKERQATAAATMQRRLAAMGELAAGIAHEINNPLGGLLNAVEALERPSLAPEKRASYHALLRNGLERIRAIVGRLLRFTPRSAKPVPLDLLQPVEDAIALVQHRAAKQGVEVALAIEDRVSLPPVLGEPNEIGQAVLNVLVNALDALDGRQSGRIDVAVRQAGDEVLVRVDDDGPGVDPALLPRIADLFFTTKDPGKGTGVGLAIVHAVVHKHGGRTLMRNRDGGGFSITLVFPAWRGSAQ